MLREITNLTMFTTSESQLNDASPSSTAVISFLEILLIQ